ncbi:hypothetical protein Tco_0709590, partial [Tanacetum coccineum]
RQRGKGAPLQFVFTPKSKTEPVPDTLKWSPRTSDAESTVVMSSIRYNTPSVAGGILGIIEGHRSKNLLQQEPRTRDMYQQ